MKKGKAFVVVGHSHWGKSRTIRSLTGSTHIGWFELDDLTIFIRRMSNDDKPDSLVDFLKKIDPGLKPIIIIALCPNFDDRNRKTKGILRLVGKKYVPYFFVLRQRYSRRCGKTEEVTHKEIGTLRSIGRVKLVRGRLPDYLRARALKEFMTANA